MIELCTCLFVQVVEVNVKVEEPGKNNVHNNAFYAEEELLRSELQAMRDCNPLSARHWIVRYLTCAVLPNIICFTETCVYCKVFHASIK